MENSEKFYKLNKRLCELERKLEDYNNEIRHIRENAKKLKKGSHERESEIAKIHQMETSKEYIETKAKVESLYYCINIFFYN